MEGLKGMGIPKEELEEFFNIDMDFGISFERGEDQNEVAKLQEWTKNNPFPGFMDEDEIRQKTSKPISELDGYIQCEISNVVNERLLEVSHGVRMAIREAIKRGNLKFDSKASEYILMLSLDKAFCNSSMSEEYTINECINNSFMDIFDGMEDK
jgi:hypothetical protein